MIVADKTLNDSVLSVTFFKKRNKPATKLHEKPPRSSRMAAAPTLKTLNNLHLLSITMKQTSQNP
jgi:hypothetical protein